MYHIIVNPTSKSGLGRKKWEELKSLLLKEKVTYNVQFTRVPMSAYKCTRRITNVDNGTENKIVVLGGDGTLNEVVNGIMDYEYTYVTYLPTGSSNDLARDMGISSDTSMLIPKFKQLRESLPAMDLGEVKFKGGRRNFIVSSGIGFDAAVCEQSQDSAIKSILNLLKLGKLTYLCTALRLLMKRSYIQAELYVDGSDEPLHVKDMLFLAVMNHRYEGGGFMFAPDADAYDGYLDICYAADVSLPRILFLLPLALRGKHIEKKGIYTLRCKSIEIRTDSKQPVHTDGEICGHFDAITYRCYEKLLKFV